MRALIVLGVLAAVAYGGWNMHEGRTAFGGRHIVPAYADARVTVYGATGCAYTTEMVRELGRAGVPFELYLINQDPAANDEIQRKLNTPTYAGRGFVTPIIEVNGTIMETPDNIHIERLLAMLDEG